MKDKEYTEKLTQFVNEGLMNRYQIYNLLFAGKITLEQYIKIIDNAERHN